MLLYRISAAQFAANSLQAFSGNGGLVGLGRWHTVGRQIVYTAQSLSLAALETLVHLQRSDKIQPYVYWVIEVPDVDIIIASDLPVGWQGNPLATRAYGDQWLVGCASVALGVPSAIIGQEFNYLLNPMHPKFDIKWVKSGPIEFKFDARLL